MSHNQRLQRNFTKGSLRIRLVFGVVFLTAIGLFTVATITYVKQRSFLYTQIDQQIKLAPQAVQESLEYQQSLQAPSGTPAPHAPNPVTGPPAGSYGQLRGPTGVVQATIAFRYGENIPATVVLPKSIPLDKPINVGTYRVIAVPVKETTNGVTNKGTIVAAIPLHGTQQTLDQLLLVESLVALIVLFLVGAGTWFFMRAGLRPLEQFTEIAEEISLGDLSQRVDADETTEVGRLGIAFNSMLDSLQAAFLHREKSEDKLRQFLADASHELRTPLTSIRGYAELSRTGVMDDPKEAMQRIEDESTRMGVLVGDLLTLARLDQMPEAQNMDVNLSEIVSNTVKDMHAVSPDREIVLNSEPDLIVSGDGNQLQQVVLNILRNAILYTDKEIHVDAFKEKNKVVVKIQDNGPGLPDDPSIVFERFWKAPREENGNKGAGLGLSIVAAIMEAHQGSIKAENLDDGACFTLVLPAK
jgi:two-component system OmpR family sensor kinase